MSKIIFCWEKVFFFFGGGGFWVEDGQIQSQFFQNDYLGDVNIAQNENRAIYSTRNRWIWVPNTNDRIFRHPHPPPQTANVIRRVTTRGTNLKFLCSIDYRRKRNVELILTNENFITNTKSTKNKLMRLMTSTSCKNKIPRAVFFLWLRKIWNFLLKVCQLSVGF